MSAFRGGGKKKDDGVKTEFVYADGAKDDVQLSGDWNDWKAIQMFHEGGGMWSVVTPVPPGPHEFKYIVDGEWKHSNRHPTIGIDETSLNNVRYVLPEPDLSHEKKNTIDGRTQARGQRKAAAAAAAEGKPTLQASAGGGAPMRMASGAGPGAAPRSMASSKPPGSKSPGGNVRPPQVKGSMPMPQAGSGTIRPPSNPLPPGANPPSKKGASSKGAAAPSPNSSRQFGSSSSSKGLKTKVEASKGGVTKGGLGKMFGK